MYVISTGDQRTEWGKLLRFIGASRTPNLPSPKQWNGLAVQICRNFTAAIFGSRNGLLNTCGYNYKATRRTGQPICTTPPAGRLFESLLRLAEPSHLPESV